jgi:uncharacterized protein YjlB
MWQRRIKYSMLNRVAKKVYAQSFYAQSCFTGRSGQFGAQKNDGIFDHTHYHWLGHDNMGIICKYQNLLRFKR